MTEAINPNAKFDQEISADIDLPFDLNNLFNMQYSFDVLKEAIQFLARQQAAMKKEHGLLADRVGSLEGRPGDGTGSQRSGEEHPTMTVFMELKNYVYNYVNQNDEDIQFLRDNHVKNHNRLNDIDKQIEFLKKLKGSGQKGAANDGGGMDMLDALQDMEANLLKRIEELEKESRDKDTDLQNQVDELKLLFDKHENDIEALKQSDKELDTSKVNQDAFDKEIHDLKEALKSMNGGQTVQFINGPTGGAGEEVTKEDIAKWNSAHKYAQKHEKDLNQLNHMLERYNHIETSVDNLNSQILQCATKEEFNDLTKQVYKLQVEMQQAQKEIRELWDELKKLREFIANQLSPSQGEFNTLKNRVDFLENGNQALKRHMSGLEKQLSTKNMSTASGTNHETSLITSDDIDRLRMEFEQHRDYANSNIEGLKKEMPHKADKQDLIDLENRLLDQLRDMLQQIRNQFATKEELQKKFSQLNRKIKEILEILNKNGAMPNEEDAMFTKKHLGPNACASCERGLVNMIGLPVDYHTWKRLPVRDPNERIAKYGPGFSRILSQMTPGDMYGGGKGQDMMYGNNGGSAMAQTRGSKSLTKLEGGTPLGQAGQQQLHKSFYNLQQNHSQSQQNL